MDKESKQKILGAFVIGFALVAGAYTVTNFGEPRTTFQPATVIESTPAERTAIEVADLDGNGIEDWRDDFFTVGNTITVEDLETEVYEAPETLTGQVGIDFLQNVLETRIYNASPDASEQVIESTIQRLERETSDFIFDTPDIRIIGGWEEEDIRSYANVMGAAITSNDLGFKDDEVTILQDIVARGNTTRVSELIQIAAYYGTLRDEALSTPVPDVFVKEHLDLINTYHAMSIDIEAMSEAPLDPIKALMRLRKYQDNVLGLQLALDNMNDALVPFGELFTQDDPAAVFALFAIRQRI